MSAVAALRKLVPPRQAAEYCDVCGVALPQNHPHQFGPGLRRVRCACARCAASSGEWLLLPETIRALPDFRLTDAQWDELRIPIGLAFFSFNTHAGRILAFYPGAAGIAESRLALNAWDEIAVANPGLASMLPDVEALLVNRIGTWGEYLVVPIDECYKLAGLIRIHWRGLSGGSMVWGEVTKFFDALRERAVQ